jgi:hypothetical protein
VIEFLVEENKSVRNIHECLCNVYGMFVEEEEEEDYKR